MSKKKYDPFTYIYEIGDLVIYKGELLDGPDEVGLIINIMSMLHDSMDVIYEIETPSGRDVVTQYDAQFILTPYWVYQQSRERRETMMDELRKFTKVAECDEP